MLVNMAASHSETVLGFQGSEQRDPRRSASSDLVDQIRVTIQQFEQLDRGQHVRKLQSSRQQRQSLPNQLPALCQILRRL
jgi:hypothetical protein